MLTAFIKKIPSPALFCKILCKDHGNLIRSLVNVNQVYKNDEGQEYVSRVERKERKVEVTYGQGF